MVRLSIFEFDKLIERESENALEKPDEPTRIPKITFQWLWEQCQRISEQGGPAWLKLDAWRGHPAVKVVNYVGVIQTPDGSQIEVLPKIGEHIGTEEARRLLLKMLKYLPGFPPLKTLMVRRADLSASRMPLLEVFMAEFLREVEHVVKRGLRSNYVTREDNLGVLRGKLLITMHLRENICRPDRFFTAHDEFMTDRPENRLLHAALQRVVCQTSNPTNRTLARTLQFVFAEIPVSTQPAVDFQRVQLNRGMQYYAEALSWARLILDELSPVPVMGKRRAPALLFPMEKVFEAFVAEHLPGQLVPGLRLQRQVREEDLVMHEAKGWFQLRPDLLILKESDHRRELVLDTKWKLLDSGNPQHKYSLSESDFYQLQAYGHSYLKGQGHVILIYPKTPKFSLPLPEFTFQALDKQLKLWVLPFCLDSGQLLVPRNDTFARTFVNIAHKDGVDAESRHRPQVDKRVLGQQLTRD